MKSNFFIFIGTVEKELRMQAEEIIDYISLEEDLEDLEVLEDLEDHATAEEDYEYEIVGVVR